MKTLTGYMAATLLLAALTSVDSANLIAPVRPPELLSNGGFEGSYKRVAPSWHENTWAAKGQDQKPQVSWDKARITHGGAAAQAITITQLPPGGGAILFQPFDFTAGHVYEGRIWLRSVKPMKVKFFFRKRTFYYNTGGAAVMSVTPNWQQITIRGGYASAMEGQFVIQPLEGGTLYIDDASLKDVTSQVLQEPIQCSDSIPRTFFGMHINKLGSHNTWPPVRFGTLRLWDTVTDWAAVEPTKGAVDREDNWNARGAPGFRMSYYLRHQQKHDPSCELIYTMGVTPLWAAAEAEPKFYAGTANAPQDLSDWRNYVRAMGKRFSDRVRYWEVWNEADQGHQYRGDIKTLCEMTRIAKEELKAIRPDNKILSPNITTQGAGFLDEFLGAGGGQYVDIISWHHYAALQPELALPAIAAVRDVMQRHGVSNKPLWNTEGKPGGNAGVPGEKDEDAPANDDIARAAVARSYLVQWAYGVRVWCWYMWDEKETETCIKLSRSTAPAGPSDYAALTPAGEAYNTVAQWLIGSRMVSKWVNPLGEGHRWIIEIARDGGYRGWIVWQTHGKSELVIPNQWGFRQVRQLDGNSTALAKNQITIGPMPVLLENQTGARKP